MEWAPLSMVPSTSSNSEKGKALEQVVKRLEEILLPEHFHVETNKRIFDENGVQEVEFDIRITGKVGSISLDWLIECRDRPSKGSGPGAWIEQLVGRRDRFNLDKVIAVSTTGFSPSAAKYAREKGIILREVEHFSEVPNEIQVRKIRYRIPHVIPPIGAPKVGFDKSKYTELPTIPNDRNGDIKIRLPPSAPARSLAQLMVGILVGHEEVFRAEDGDEKTFDVGFENQSAILEFENGERRHIVGFRFQVKVKVEVVEDSAPALAVYSEEGKCIGCEADYTLRTSLGEVKQSVRWVYKDDGTEILQVPPAAYPGGKFVGLRCFHVS